MPCFKQETFLKIRDSFRFANRIKQFFKLTSWNQFCFVLLGELTRAITSRQWLWPDVNLLLSARSFPPLIPLPPFPFTVLWHPILAAIALVVHIWQFFPFFWWGGGGGGGDLKKGNLPIALRAPMTEFRANNSPKKKKKRLITGQTLERTEKHTTYLSEIVRFLFKSFHIRRLQKQSYQNRISPLQKTGNL